MKRSEIVKDFETLFQKEFSRLKKFPLAKRVSSALLLCELCRKFEIWTVSNFGHFWAFSVPNIIFTGQFCYFHF